MEKIWFKQYESNVARDIDVNQYTSIVDLFEKSCAAAASKNAFYNFGTYITYKQLDDYSRAFAAYLLNDLGLKKGDRVAIMMPNLLQYPVALFGILRAGLVVVNVNPLYTPTELTHLLNDSGAKTIIILENFASVLEKALLTSVIKNIIVTKFGDLLTGATKYLANFIVKYVKRMVPRYRLPHAVAFSQVLIKGAALSFEKPEITQRDIAFLQYTGGTTGIAKAAVLSHSNMVANTLQITEWGKNSLQKGKEIIITALPLYHILSLTANCLIFVALESLNVLITNPRDIPAFIKEMKKFKFTAITGVNTLFNALINNPKIKEVDFSETRFAITGGMAMQKAVAERWEALTGCRLIEGYGLTEASPVVCANPVNVAGFNGSIGLPLSSTDVSIRDEDNKEVPMGDAGELCVKGPQVMHEYWQNPSETRKTFTPDGWLRTGDIAVMDKEGFFYIVDRKKDMIIVSGFNVYPNEVEDVIASHPGVLEAAVVGVPNEKSGEMVKAFIVKKDANLHEDDIITYCQQYLTRYKIPKAIEFRDELPKTPVGKILRRKLRD